MVRSGRSPTSSSPPSPRSGPGSRPRSSKRQPVDLPGLLPSIENALAQRSVLTSTDLSALGVPRAQQPDALARLQTMGFEVQGKGVRVALAAQVRRLLSERQMIAVEPALLKELVKGAKPAELKTLAERVVRAGEARLVVRGKRRFLALPRFELVAGEALGRLRLLADELSSQCKDALGLRPAAALFRYDVQEALQRMLREAAVHGRESGVESASEPTSKQTVTTPATEAAGVRAASTEAANATAAPGPTEGEVLAALRRTVDGKVGMSFVPATVQLLEQKHERGRVHEVLLAMARRRVIELQGEAGLGRFSQQELDRAPPGLRGFSLVWGRILEETP